MIQWLVFIIRKCFKMFCMTCIGGKFVFSLINITFGAKLGFFHFLPEETGIKGFFRMEETAVLSGLNCPSEETANVPCYMALYKIT